MNVPIEVDLRRERVAGGSPSVACAGVAAALPGRRRGSITRGTRRTSPKLRRRARRPSGRHWRSGRRSARLRGGQGAGVVGVRAVEPEGLQRRRELARRQEREGGPVTVRRFTGCSPKGWGEAHFSGKRRRDVDELHPVAGVDVGRWQKPPLTSEHVLQVARHPRGSSVSGTVFAGRSRRRAVGLDEDLCRAGSACCASRRSGGSRPGTGRSSAVSAIRRRYMLSSRIRCGSVRATSLDGEPSPCRACEAPTAGPTIAACCEARARSPISGRAGCWRHEGHEGGEDDPVGAHRPGTCPPAAPTVNSGSTPARRWF